VALGLSLGPFHLNLPLPGFPYRFVRRGIALRDRRSQTGVDDRASLGGAEPGERADLGIFYPSLALTGVDDDIFRADGSSSWPFGYDAIFRGAFTKSLPTQDPQACRADDRTNAIVAGISREIRPDAAQRAGLEKLRHALAMASAALAKACPKAIPPQPVARLRLMQWQIEGLSTAVDLIRPPLQQFEQSLDAGQRARFAAAPSASAAAAACGATPTSIDWSIDAIDQSVRPDAGQQGAVADLRHAVAGAASDLAAHCPKSLPADPLARLEAIETRLDASWRAMLAVQVAISDFEGRLSNQERGRFAAIDVAQAH
jgi:hypothetical protein